MGLVGMGCKYAVLVNRFRLDQTNCDSVFFGVVTRPSQESRETASEYACSLNFDW